MSTDPAFWDRLAEKYAAQPVADPAAFDRKIAVMVSHLRPDSVVLDVGCGTGSLALRLAPSAGHVHGLDLSPEMIRIARGKAAAAGAPPVTFHIGPFDDSFTALPDGSVDLLSACSLLHLVDDRAAALARAVRLLKPGGVFVTSTVCLGETWIPYGPMITVARWLGKAPEVTIFKKATLAEDLRRAGLVDVEAPDVGAKAEIAFFVAKRPPG